VKQLHKLKKLSVSKISLVPAGSNPQADVVFYKAKDVSRATFAEIMAGEVLRGTLYKIYDACYVMQDAISSAMYGQGDSAADTRASINQFKKYVDDLLDDLEAGKVKKEDLNLETLAITLIARHNAWVEKIAPKETTMQKAFKDMNAEEQAAHVVELERQLAEAKAKPAADPTPATDPAQEEVLRGLSPEAQAIFKRQQDEIAAQRTANEATAAVVRQLQDESETRRFVEIARAEIPNLTGTLEEKAAMLRTFHGLGKEKYDAQLKQLKAANAALASSALREVGRSEEGGEADDTPAGKLDAIAKEIVSKDATGKTTYAVAYSRACSENTDLYAQMRRERFNGRRSA
jgi:hypothetical protein